MRQESPAARRVALGRDALAPQDPGDDRWVPGLSATRFVTCLRERGIDGPNPARRALPGEQYAWAQRRASDCDGVSRGDPRSYRRTLTEEDLRCAA
jgi:hypothetical protein